MERTRPEYPGVLPIGVELPLDPMGATVYRILRNSDGPVRFGAGAEHLVPMEMAAAFNVQSFIAMAFYPQIGKPWSFGLHQCSYERVWTPEEERLFQDVGRRLADALSRLLTFRNLLESEKQIKQLIDASPVAMLVSSGADEHVEWVNDKFIELFGYTTEDMPDVEHWWPLAYPDEAYQAKIKAQWEADTEQAIREKSQIKPMEATVKCKDGSYRYVEFRLSSVGEKHIVTFIDLTERKRMEEALSASEAELRTLINAMTDIIFVGNSEGRYLKIVDTSPSLLYKPSKELLGKTLHDVFPKDLADFFLNHLRQALNTQKSVNFEYCLPIGDKKLWFYATVSPMTDDKILMVARDITDRKQAEDALRESEERYRQLINLSPDGISIHSQGYILFVNPAMTRMSGATSADQMLGKSVLDFVHPDFRELVRKRIAEMQITGLPISFIEEKLLRLDGTSFDVELAAVPYSFKDTQYIQVVARDITERKRAEDELQQNREATLQFSKQLAALQEITNELSKAESSDNLCRQAVQLGRTHMGFDRVGIWFIEEHLGIMRGSFGTDEHGGLRDERNAQVQFRHEGLAWRLFSHKDQIALVEHRPLYDHLGREVGMGDNAMAALWDGDKVIGVISVDNLFTDRPISEHQLEVLRLYATTLGHLITRKRAEEALRASENRFRVLSDNAFVGIYIIQDGRLSYVNSTLAKIFGYTPEELTGADPALVIHPDDQAMVSENIRRRIVGEVETVHYEFRGRCKDGETKNIEVLGGRIDFGGKTAVIGNLMDITDRKRAEDILRESEEKYRTLIQKIQAAVVVHGADTQILTSNSMAQ